MKNLFFTVLTVAAFAYSASYAATDSLKTSLKGGDAQLWTTLYFKYQFGLRHSITLRAENRGRKNFSDFNHFSGELKYAYHPKKWYQLSLGYRCANKGKGEIENKFFTDFHLFYTIGNFSFAYRQRIQYEYQPAYSGNEATNDWQSKNKFWLKYDSLGNFTPYLAGEIYWQMGGNDKPETNKKFHRARWEAGGYYSINCKNSVALFGILQREWNKPQDTQKVLYVIGLTYFYKFAWKLCEDEHIKYDAAE